MELKCPLHVEDSYFFISLPEVQIQISNCPMKHAHLDIPKPHQIYIPKGKLLTSHQIVLPLRHLSKIGTSAHLITQAKNLRHPLPYLSHPHT